MLAIDREAEYLNSRAAAASGASPRVVEFVPEHHLLVVDFVELTLTADVPEPPLVLGENWPVLVLTLVAFLAAAAGVAVVRSRSAFRAAYVEDERR